MTIFSASTPEQSPQNKKAIQKKNEPLNDEEIFNLYCTNCGAPLEKGDLFCSECGTKAEENIIKMEEESSAPLQEEKPVNISKDRMSSILETQNLKKGIINSTAKKKDVPELLKIKTLPELKAINPIGNYVSYDSYMTQYLTIESIQENIVKASIKTIFDKGGYSTEFYQGTFVDNHLHLSMVDSDLHPLPDDFIPFLGENNTVHHTIKTSEIFDGIVNDDIITGSYAGQFSKTVTFKKC